MAKVIPIRVYKPSRLPVPPWEEPIVFVEAIDLNSLTEVAGWKEHEESFVREPRKATFRIYYSSSGKYYLYEERKPGPNVCWTVPRDEAVVWLFELGHSFDNLPASNELPVQGLGALPPSPNVDPIKILREQVESSHYGLRIAELAKVGATGEKTIRRLWDRMRHYALHYNLAGMPREPEAVCDMGDAKRALDEAKRWLDSLVPPPIGNGAPNRLQQQAVEQHLADVEWEINRWLYLYVRRVRGVREIPNQIAAPMSDEEIRAFMAAHFNELWRVVPARLRQAYDEARTPILNIKELPLDVPPPAPTGQPTSVMIAKEFHQSVLRVLDAMDHLSKRNLVHPNEDIDKVLGDLETAVAAVPSLEDDLFAGARVELSDEHRNSWHEVVLAKAKAWIINLRLSLQDSKRHGQVQKLLTLGKDVGLVRSELRAEWQRVSKPAEPLPNDSSPLREQGEGLGATKRMTVEEANVKAVKLARKLRAGFFAMSERQQAKQIGCSWQTWTRTKFFQTAQGKRPSDQKRKPSSPKTESLTAGREAVTGEGDKDEILQGLIAEQAADGEPSPLESDIPNRPRKVRSRKRL